MNKQFTAYMEEVMAECLGKIPESKRVPARTHPSAFNIFDMMFSGAAEKPEGIYGTQTLRTPWKETRERAWQARRQGARTRAQAIEWAYDSLIRDRGYVRVGEVYIEESPDYYKDGLSMFLAPSEKKAVKHYAALVVERGEDE